MSKSKNGPKRLLVRTEKLQLIHFISALFCTFNKLLLKLQYFVNILRYFKTNCTLKGQFCILELIINVCSGDSIYTENWFIHIFYILSQMSNM